MIRGRFLLTFLFGMTLFVASCKKDEPVVVDPSDNLAIDSLVPTSRDIVVWEQISIKVYSRGQGLNYNWNTNHGTLVGAGADTVGYWACPTCVGLNVIECELSNEYGTVSDTVMIRVR
ncbi:MAG: hypothetical protein CVU11_08110 [Bacteroidetes bacterium HGW-Bacteroidetes-6]|nr:MAG: hypothetical protein CVU11_08110 [Bacteroidetes bacterium HGW-Bacteroidetes-6]